MGFQAAVLFQILWSGTVFLGLLFIFLGLRNRENRTYLTFGVSVVLLCALTTLDVFITDSPGTVRFDPAWFYLRHLIAFAIGPVMALFTMNATQTYSNIQMLAVTGSAIASSVPFLWDLGFGSGLVLATGRDFERPGPLYVPSVLPYLLVTLFCIFRSLATNLRRSETREPKLTWLAIAGWMCVSAGGMMEFFLVTFNLESVQSGVFLLTGISMFSFLVAFGLSESFASAHAEARQLVRKLDVAYMDVRRNSGFAEIGKSAAAISHEIRNNLAVIKGNSLLLERIPFAGDAGLHLTRITSSMTRLDDFVSGVLDFSRACVIGRTEEIRLSSLVASLAQECRDADFPDLEISAVPGDDPVIRGDRGKLAQAILNALRNSREASAEKVRIRIRCVPGKALLAIEDDGRGCDPESLEHIFQPFFTTRGKTGGTGLGMSILKAILEAHGGTVSAYSKANLPEVSGGFLLNLVLPAVDGLLNGGTRPRDFLFLRDLSGVGTKKLQTVRNLGIELSGISGDEIATHRVQGQGGSLILFGREQLEIFAATRRPAGLSVLAVDERNNCRISTRAGLWSEPKLFCEETLAEMA